MSTKKTKKEKTMKTETQKCPDKRKGVIELKETWREFHPTICVKLRAIN